MHTHAHGAYTFIYYGIGRSILRKPLGADYGVGPFRGSGLSVAARNDGCNQGH